MGTAMPGVLQMCYLSTLVTGGATRGLFKGAYFDFANIIIHINLQMFG